MTNKEIIAKIKYGCKSGVEALAKKYGITFEQAFEIADCIKRHNAHIIRKTVNNVTGNEEIFVTYRFRGFMGNGTTSVRFVLQDSEIAFVYGDF